jgi:hypothetical protein
VPKTARHKRCTPVSRIAHRRCPCWGPCGALIAGCRPRPRLQPASRPTHPSHRPHHRWRLHNLQQQHSLHVCTLQTPSQPLGCALCFLYRAGKLRKATACCNASRLTGCMVSTVRTKVAAAIVRAGIAHVVSAGASSAVCCPCHGPRHPHPRLQEQLRQLLGLHSGNISSVTAVGAPPL